MKIYIATYEFYEVFDIIGVFNDINELIKKIDKIIEEDNWEEENYYVYEYELNTTKELERTPYIVWKYIKTKKASR